MKAHQAVRTTAVNVGLMTAALMAGCMPHPPGTPMPAQPTIVEASFDRTWDAVIDIFSERNIPIANLEKASGLIVAERLRTLDREAADCGEAMSGRLPAAWVTHNVVARPHENGASTIVRVTARWTTENGMECSTRGTWEGRIQSAVKQRAEGPQIRSGSTAVQPAPDAFVTRSETNLLERPTPASRVLRALPAGSEVVVLGRLPGYLYVRVGGMEGYVLDSVFR